MLEAAVKDLKYVISDHDGRNVADRKFTRRVDELLSVFYDDIGEITTVPSHTLFDLFVIKVLYVEHGSTDAAVVEYLSRLLERYLFAGNMYQGDDEGPATSLYLSDVLQEMEEIEDSKNIFEAYRQYGDNSLFVTGVFPGALRDSHRNRWDRTVPLVDRAYYVSTGKRCYKMAAEHELAEDTQQQEMLAKLSSYFEVYLNALNELSERYIMGFDMSLIADKMLDNINDYRDTGDDQYLQNASRYAAILKVSPDALSGVMKRRPAFIKPESAA
jgi:hypothetical protein